MGIVQVAVSKYLNGKYSKEVKQLKDYIEKNGLNSELIQSILDGESSDAINRKIDNLCNNEKLVMLSVEKIQVSVSTR